MSATRSDNREPLRRLAPSAELDYFREIEAGLGGEFKLQGGTTESDSPCFQHATSQIRFRLVPSGIFTMGITGEQEQAARAIQDPPPLTFSEMQPPKKVSVSSFLVSEAPIALGTCQRLVDHSVLAEYKFPDVEASLPDPIYVRLETATAIAARLGCRLPHEEEWEYACRAGTETLFPWGDVLPPEEELRGWLDFSLPRAEWKANSFGLSMLFTGDWCTDEWKPSHKAEETCERGVYTIKGGGSVFWPWQRAGEWVWCMPAMRMPSTALFKNQTAAFRVIRELPR